VELVFDGEVFDVVRVFEYLDGVGGDFYVGVGGEELCYCRLY